jgi:hypothetical protein
MNAVFMEASALTYKTIYATGLALLLTINSNYCAAGPYPPAVGLTGSTAIAATDSAILGWATGYNNYNAGTQLDLEWQTPQLALHTAGNSNGSNLGFNFDIVSLGRGGQITLTFDSAIGNGDGFDFAIFENSFSDTFLELAWVEVSSNGIDFVRFQTASLTPVNVNPFDNIMDASDIDGLAGKYRAGYGTPFDLSELPANPNVDINHITHVRITDVVGDGLEDDDLPHALSPFPIYDPYPTSGSAGFDLDAVAVLHFAEPAHQENVPIPAIYIALLGGLFIFSFSNAKKRRALTSVNVFKL